MNVAHWCSQVYSQFSANHRILMGRNMEISHHIVVLTARHRSSCPYTCHIARQSKSLVYVTTKMVHVDINSLLSHRSLLSFIFSFFDLTFFSSTSVKTHITHKVNVHTHTRQAQGLIDSTRAIGRRT